MPETKAFLLIDKPAGLTSFDVIRQLRRVTGIRRIGHTGTLDPFATGLLICALGLYTRLCGYLESADKQYQACLKLGESTTTGDPEGEVTTGGSVPSSIDIDALTTDILALHELPTPRYSAVKIGGKPAYSYARQGLELDLPPRPVQISEFSILEYNPPLLTFTCTVSKGTYIRSLSEYIAGRLGTIGHTIALRRTRIGSLSVDSAHALEQVTPENYVNKFTLGASLFADAQQFLPDANALSALRNGQSIADPGPDAHPVIIIDSVGEVLGVARRQNSRLAPVINLT